MIDIPEAVGQDRIAEYLDRCINGGRIPHALILNGEKGSGKLEIAKAFANQVLDNKNEEHPDIKIIDLRPPKTKYVDMIRDHLIKSIYMNPYSGSHKFYIIAGAGLMPIVAQNAILKSLEEPPEYVSIIMLTDTPAKLLPTIRSRAIKLYIRPIENDKIYKSLIKNGVEREKAKIATGLCMGNISKASEIADDNEYLEFVETVAAVAANIAKGRAIAEFPEEIKIFTERINEFLLLMEILLRDVLVYKLTENETDITVFSWILQVKIIASKCSFEKLGALRKRIADTYEAIAANGSKDVLIELLMIEIGGIN